MKKSIITCLIITGIIHGAAEDQQNTPGITDKALYYFFHKPINAFCGSTPVTKFVESKTGKYIMYGFYTNEEDFNDPDVSEFFNNTQIGRLMKTDLGKAVGAAAVLMAIWSPAIALLPATWIGPVADEGAVAEGLNEAQALQNILPNAAQPNPETITDKSSLHRLLCEDADLSRGRQERKDMPWHRRPDITNLPKDQIPTEGRGTHHNNTKRH